MKIDIFILRPIFLVLRRFFFFNDPFAVYTFPPLRADYSVSHDSPILETVRGHFPLLIP